MTVISNSAYGKNYFEATQNRYVRFSQKFHNDLIKFHDKKTSSPQLTFLSGPAGTGKSFTLHNEYIVKLIEEKIEYFSFSFLPDQPLENYNFLNEINRQFIEYIEKAILLEPTNISLQTAQKNLANIGLKLFNPTENIFDYAYKHKLFTEILSEIAQVKKITLVFEDIHLARRNFADFINTISEKRNLNVHILCTTRRAREAHDFSVGCVQKWFYFEKLSKNNFKKYINSLNLKSKKLSLSVNKLLSLSDANPFYIKELYHLEEQRMARASGSFKEPTFFLGQDDGKTSILGMRFCYLNPTQKEILHIISAIGFNVKFSELFPILKHFNLSNCEHELHALEALGFIKQYEDRLRFQHHLIYDSIKNKLLGANRINLYDRLFQFYLKNKQFKYYQNLIECACESHKFFHACLFAKKLADHMYQTSEFDMAAHYYDRYIECLKLCPPAPKTLSRMINALIPLHASCLFLGENKKAEVISSYLANISQETTLPEKYKIHSTLMTAYWTVGSLPEARDYALRNIENADILNLRDAKIAANARFGTLSMEMGDFKNAVKMHEKSLSYMHPDEDQKKFGMFVEAYPCSKSILSICHYELGNIQDAIGCGYIGYDCLEKTEDPFTKMFISMHCGYAMAMMGKFEKASQYLEIGLKTRKKTKATLLVPAGLSILSLCNLHLGNKKEATRDLTAAQELAGITFQGSKKGIVDIAYVESLLINFGTGNFVEEITRIIDETKKMHQISYVGWFYFYKAIYHAFYSRSVQGFIGSFAKANAIAQNLEMGTLLANLKSLANLEESGLLKFKSTPSDAPGFFDKALFFYNLTRDVKPISFHIES